MNAQAIRSSRPKRRAGACTSAASLRRHGWQRVGSPRTQALRGSGNGVQCRARDQAGHGGTPWHTADGSICCRDGRLRRKPILMPRSRLSPHLKPAWRGKRRSACSRAAWRRRSSPAKVLEQNPTSEIGLTLLGACLGRLGETAAAIQHSIGRWRSDRIAMRRLARDFLSGFSSRRGFRGATGDARYWWDAIGSNYRGASLRLGRSIRKNASSLGMFLPTSGLIRRHLLLAGAAIPRQSELPDQLLLLFGDASIRSPPFSVAGRCLDRRP